MNIWNSSDYSIFRFKVRYALYPSCVDCFLRDGCSFLWDDKADCWGICPAVEIACGIGKLFFVLKLASKKKKGACYRVSEVKNPALYGEGC